MTGSEEQASRLRAAMAYSGRTEKEIAGDLGIAVRTLARWKVVGIPHKGDPRIIRDISVACGVPYAWFTADLTQLWRIPLTPEDAFSEAAVAADAPPTEQR